MNENKKSAIEQMVEMLDKKVATFIEKCGGVDKLDYFEAEYIEPYHLMLKEARRLLKEEQAQKPTAPAGLVKDNLESWEDEAKAFYEATGYLRPGKDPGIIGDTDYRERRDREWKTWRAGYGYCASRYRPAPSSADEGLRELKDYIENKTPRFELKNCSTDFGIYYCAVIQEINKILSRHPSTDKCGELVKRASDDGFHHGMALALISIGRDHDQPTLAKNVAEGYGLKAKDFEGHGIDQIDMTKLKTILSEFSKDADKEGR